MTTVLQNSSSVKRSLWQDRSTVVAIFIGSILGAVLLVLLCCIAYLLIQKSRIRKELAKQYPSTDAEQSLSSSNTTLVGPNGRKPPIYLSTLAETGAPQIQPIQGAMAVSDGPGRPCSALLAREDTHWGTPSRPDITSLFQTTSDSSEGSHHSASDDSSHPSLHTSDTVTASVSSLKSPATSASPSIYSYAPTLRRAPSAHLGDPRPLYARHNLHQTKTMQQIRLDLERFEAECRSSNRESGLRAWGLHRYSSMRSTGVGSALSWNWDERRKSGDVLGGATGQERELAELWAPAERFQEVDMS